MKKGISVILSSIIALSGVVPVMANETDALQKALISVRERIMDTEIFDEFSSDSYENGDNVLYSFYWNSTGENSKSLSVEVDNSNIINYYNYHDGSYKRNKEHPYINETTSAEALEKTKVLIKKLNPSIYDSLVISKTTDSSSLFSNTHRYKIDRYENGVYVEGNSGYVTVDGSAENILNFNLNYTNGITFAEKSDLMTKDEIEKQFVKNIGMELLYTVDYSDEDEKIKLIYSPKLSYNQYIDAKTGELKDKNDEIFVTNSAAGEKLMMDYAKEESADNGRIQLTLSEINEIETIEGLISKEEAEKNVRKISSLSLTDDMELNRVNLYKNNDDERFYVLTFVNKNDKGEIEKSGNAQINAKTGELINWSSYSRDYSYNEKNIDRTKIIESAKIAVEEIVSHKLEESNINSKFVMDDTENDESSSVQYTRYVNDIKFANDRINVNIDSETGKVTHFNIGYTNEEFPSPAGVISEETAIEKLFDNMNLDLQYIFVKSDVKADNYDGAVLGYPCNTIRNMNIDPFTGEIVNKNNYEEVELLYSDIKGHYGEEAITTLAEFGIGFEGGEFKPDAIITQEDYVSLLTATFMNNYPIILRADKEISNEFKQAERNGILKTEEINPQEPITRETAAVYLIRTLGVEEYASLPGIYVSMFNDVTKNVGAISILGAMGVFKGDGKGNFNPDKQLTRADAAIVIYNYLSRNR